MLYLTRGRYSEDTGMIALLSAFLVLLGQQGSPGGACTLTIHVDGFRNHKGVAGGTVFKSPAGWPEDNDKALVHKPFPIEGDHATLTFQLPPGKYSVAVLHDENANHKLDRNLLRYPKEGFGFANNPKIGLSAPPFQAAQVDVGCPETSITVHLVYK